MMQPTNLIKLPAQAKYNKDKIKKHGNIDEPSFSAI